MKVISRRRIIGLATAMSITSIESAFTGPALAQRKNVDPEVRVRRLEARARQENVIPPASATPRSAEPGSFRYWKARLLEIINNADRLGRSQELAEEADRLLANLHAAERMPRVSTGDLRAQAPSFDKLKAEYHELFDHCVIRPNRETAVAADLKILTLPESVPRYRAVQEKTGVPWYFIALVHDLEASFRFRGHLHNGDSLAERTVNEPKHRPPVWKPPIDWETSAQDALDYERAQQKNIWGPPDDWTLERTLYRLEMYNGFGSRAHGIKSPYLWGFSTYYVKGKYTADKHYDPDAVSDQCGAAVLLFALVRDGKIARPANSL